MKEICRAKSASRIGARVAAPALGWGSVSFTFNMEKIFKIKAPSGKE